MAKPYKGNITFGSAFSPNGAKPLDDRLVVETTSDLLTLFKDGTAYKGMLVTVLDTQSAYMLGNGVPTDINNWIKLATAAHVEDNDRSIDLLNSSVNAIEKYFTTTGVQGVIDTFVDVSNFLGKMKDSSNLFDMMAAEHANMTSYVDTGISNTSANIHATISDLSNNLANFKTSTGTDMNTKMTKVQQVIGVDASFKDSRINNSNVLDYVDATVDDASKYRTGLGDNVQTTVATGDIAKGTTVATLKGMSTNEIITKMLFKDYQPTTTYPSISINAFSPAIIELGSTMARPTVTKTDGIVKALANDGSGVTWDATSKTWTEWASAETFKVNGTATTTWPYTPASTGTFNVVAEKGYTRISSAWNGMTSQGNNATPPSGAVASGTSTSNTASCKVVNPIFTNGTWTTASASISYPASAATTPNKTVADDGDVYILFASQAAGTAFEIYLPTTKRIKNAWLRNELTGNYDNSVTFTKSGTKSVTTLKGNMTYDVYKYSNATQGNAKAKINFG